MIANRVRVVHRRRVLSSAALAAAASLLTASIASAQTFLSVDFNGGTIGSTVATSLGWNGATYDPVAGQIWQPWGGAGTLGGDGTQLPAGPNNGIVPPILSINKTFTVGAAVSSGTVNITLGAQNLAPSTLNSLNSRDRGAPTTGTTNFGDMYRDFIFVSRDFVRQNGANPMIITMAGLNPNTTYNFTGYAYDPFQPGQQIFGVANPIVFDYPTQAGEAPANGMFGSPQEPMWTSIMAQRISWPPGTNPLTEDDYSSTFKFTTDSAGNATFYEWGNASTQGAAILCGLQIGTVNSSTRTATTSGTWGAGPWSNGVPDADGAVANFGASAAPQTVTIEGAGRTVGVLNIASANAYTVAGGALTLTETFATDATLPPGQFTPTTGHAQVNVLGGAAINVNHVISAPVVLGQNTSINTESPQATLTVSGAVSGTGGLNKLGPGRVVMNGNNTYGGTTNIFAGSLIVNGTHNGGTQYHVTSGATLGGNGTLILRDDAEPPGTTAGPQPGMVVLWNGGTIAPGESVGTFTVDRLAMGNLANRGQGVVNFNIELGAASADRLVVTDTNGLFFASTGAGNGTANFNVSVLAGAAAGTFTIVDYSGSILDQAGAPLADLSRFSLPVTSAGGFSFSLFNNTANTSIDLAVIVGAATNATWNVDTSGDWSLGTNWTGGTAPNGVDNIANFGSAITAPRTVTVDAPKTVGTMNFDSAIGYTIGGGNAITLESGGSQVAINVTAGSHVISAPLVLNDNLTINSAGSGVAITGNLTATGRSITKIGAGTVQFENVRSASLNVNAGSAKISAKGTPNTTGGTSVVQSLSISAGASLDLTNNSMIVDYTGAVGTLVDVVRQHLQSGRLTSSAAVAGQRNLGYGDNAIAFLNKANFGGQAVDTSSLLIKYTYLGDLNLDGQVDITDLGRLATFWQTNGPWTSGDMDYNGFVDITDLGALATNWQAGVGSPLGPDFNTALASVGLGGSSVPEPAAIGLIGLSLAGVASRRVRRNHVVVHME